jgi:hypothetical protein
MRHALLDKIVLPNLLNPTDQLPEFIKKGHLVKIALERNSPGCFNKPPAALSKAWPELIAPDGFCAGLDR